MYNKVLNFAGLKLKNGQWFPLYTTTISIYLFEKSITTKGISLPSLNRTNIAKCLHKNKVKDAYL